MSVLTRRRTPRDPQAVAVGIGFGLLAAVAGLVWLAVHLGYWWDDLPAPPARPIVLIGDLVHGRLPWTPSCTAALAALTLAAAIGVTAGALLVGHARRGRPAIDRAARELGRGRALYPLTVKAAARKAKKLGVVGFIGHAIGPTVADRQQLVSDVEATRVTFAGPRMGKTTTWGIPQIIDAPGFAVATGNKPDLVNATRDLRTEAGRVWVFDPMRIVDEPADWFWDPISVITGPAAAQRYAHLFGAAARTPGARTDDYFGPEATALLGNLLLACAVARRPLTAVYGWATTPNDAEPARLLEAAGHALPARAVRGVIDAPTKERGGIYGGVRRTLSFLLNDAVLPWILPDDRRRPFDPYAFVRSTDTLYLLSREGVGSTGPLVLALTVAVTEAAEEYANASPGGRLPVPGTFVLDEAANIVKWPDLPELYSHYGSKCLLMDTILQSPAQAARVWGKDGVAQLVASATVMLYGGGVRDVEWLAALGQMVGHYRPVQVSATSSRHGWSTSRSDVRELTLDVSDLADLDATRAMVFGYGTPATLVRKVPWMDGKHAAAIRASLAAHDPADAARFVPAEPDVPSPKQLRGTNPWART